MKPIFLSFLLLISVSFSLQAQQGVSINTDNSAPHNSAALDVKSAVRGFLPPRMTTSERNSISAPAAGLQVYNTDTQCVNFFNGTGWIELCGGGGCVAPSQPGAITGTAAQIPSVTGQVYRVAAIPGATNYNWTVPAGWSITGGQGTLQVTVTSGTLNSNGNISVVAENECGASSATALAVTVNCPSIGTAFGGGVVAYRAPAGCAGVIAQQYDGLPNYNWQLSTDYCGWSPPVNGFGGWVLPDQTQLGYLYTNRVAVGGFTTQKYWSSVPVSSNAWIQDFSNGSTSQLNRTETVGVRFRCIRTFSL